MIFQYFAESIVPRLLTRRQPQESTFQTIRPKVTTLLLSPCVAWRSWLRTCRYENTYLVNREQVRSDSLAPVSHFLYHRAGGEYSHPSLRLRHISHHRKHESGAGRSHSYAALKRSGARCGRRRNCLSSQRRAV